MASVAAADVNGDGYADLVVGAFWQDNPEGEEGNAFVYYGGAAGIPAAGRGFDATLPAAAARIAAEPAAAVTGARSPDAVRAGAF